MPHAGLAKAKAAGKPAKALPLVKDPVCKGGHAGCGKPGTLKTLSCVANMHNYDFKYDIEFPQWAPDSRIDIFGNLCMAGDECL
eukprot:gene51038-9649_t